ncbi:MAG: DUF4838 domain-containing protein [Planctomycetota bacterium]|nr:DUF4838 domain-containing protein [Planctomycetota bacterium]MDA1137715.1 DUF4838 domain-containing protein [Planctomycetota bacterium]
MAGPLFADEQLTLADGGQSEYVIVRPAKSSPSQIYAGEELQTFFKQITGYELPVVTDAGGLPAKSILLGWTGHSAAIAEKVDLELLADDGFSLQTKGDHLLIVGGPVRGTLYGVYEFLEKYGGCRWFTKTHSVIPERKTWKLSPLNETRLPAFAMREPFWWPMFDGNLAARNKANGNRMELTEKHGGKVRFGKHMFVHTFNHLLSPGKYFKEHPEYFSEINGVRTAERSQLCLTNTDVLRIVTEAVLRDIREDPTAKLFSVSQNDWDGHCTCKPCLEIDTREGSPSGTMIQFVNQVAEAAEKEFPNVWIETLAYQYTRHPPKTLRPRHNVVPRLCSIECDFSLPLDVSPFPQNVKFVEDIKGWAVITDKLFIWDYTTNFGHYVGPHPNFNCLQGNVKFFRENHVVGLFEQGNYQSPHGEFAELRAWVLARLLWNPDQDIEALYDDFFRGYYGPAAKPIRNYFDQLQALTKDPGHVLRIWSNMNSPWYSEEFFATAVKLWEEAEQLTADHKVFSYHVRMSALPVMYARLVRWPEMDGRYQFEDGKFTAVGLEKDYIALASEFLKRIAEGKVTALAENSQRHESFITLLKSRTKGLKPVSIESGHLKASVIPLLGGRICSFTYGNDINILHVEKGGIDFVDLSKPLVQVEDAPYKIYSAGAASIHLGRIGRDQIPISKVISLEKEALKVTAVLENSGGRPQIVRPVLRAAFDLGDANSVFVKFGNERWFNVPAQADRNVSGTTVGLRGVASPELTLASSETGRQVGLQFSGSVDRVYIECDVRAGSTRIHVFFAAQELAANSKSEFALMLKPMPPVAGLPRVNTKGDHSPNTVVIEDCFIGLGRPGEWGEWVADDDAEDGFAAKLFNSHYEWCLQWRTDPGLFVPGAIYKVRARIRVKKTDQQGEAFWAGVYDIRNKKDQGQIAPKTEDVGETYKWYDLATWVPESEQYVWVGPGRFDKKGGKTSAIEAVFVDRFEFKKVE